MEVLDDKQRVRFDEDESIVFLFKCYFIVRVVRKIKTLDETKENLLLIREKNIFDDFKNIFLNVSGRRKFIHKHTRA